MLFEITAVGELYEVKNILVAGLAGGEEFSGLTSTSLLLVFLMLGELFSFFGAKPKFVNRKIIVFTGFSGFWCRSQGA